MLDPSREMMSFSIPFVRYILTYLLDSLSPVGSSINADPITLQHPLPTEEGGAEGKSRAQNDWMDPLPDMEANRIIRLTDSPRIHDIGLTAILPRTFTRRAQRRPTVSPCGSY